MFGVSLDTLKQALGLANEATKSNTEAATKPASTISRKTKRLSSKSLSGVVSLTQKVGGTDRV
jgi:hypothetical protein